MDEELLYFQAHTGYRNYKDRKDRLQKTVDFIRDKSDLLQAENVMAVLAIGPGRWERWNNLHLLCSICCQHLSLNAHDFKPII